MYVARQPILDRARRIAGYELLFRSPDRKVDDGTYMTASVAAKAFADAGLSDAVGPHRGFINVNAEFLLGNMVEFLPPRRTVLEILEDTRFTLPLVERCRSLKAAGYAFAADDYRGDLASITPVLDLLDIIKVDLPQVAPRERERMAREFRGKAVLAEKVETAEEAQSCEAAGYALFQGYFFARPENLASSADPGRLAALRLLTLVMQEASDAQIDAELKRHPDLGTGLLRLVNSAAVSPGRRISSFRQALTVLGRRHMQLWLQILVYLGTAGGNAADSPLVQLAAVRGKTMELLAQRSGRDGEHACLTGLVSLLNAALGMPLAIIAERLALDAEITSALTERAGGLGALLALAEAMERGDDVAVRQALDALPGIRGEHLGDAAAVAQRWACALGGDGERRDE